MNICWETKDRQLMEKKAKAVIRSLAKRHGYNDVALRFSPHVSSNSRLVVKRSKKDLHGLDIIRIACSSSPGRPSKGWKIDGWSFDSVLLVEAMADEKWPWTAILLRMLSEAENGAKVIFFNNSDWKTVLSSGTSMEELLISIDLADDDQ